MILQVKGTEIEIEYLPDSISVWEGDKCIERGGDGSAEAILDNILDERFFLCLDCDSYQPRTKEAYWHKWGKNIQLCEDCCHERLMEEGGERWIIR